MKREGRRLHAQAAKAREEGKFEESLDFNDKALFAYDAADDTPGFAEGIACRSITLRVYANAHDSRRVLTLAKYEMMASVALARENGEPQALALPLFNLAQLQEDLGEVKDAVVSYQEAVTNMQTNPPEIHNRPAVLANMRSFLATCEYKAGDKSALERAEKALQALESADEPNKYNKDVWLSGGHMRITAILRRDNPAKAKEHLEKAKDIIKANPELKLRQQQWEKLAKNFNEKLVTA